MKRLIITQHQTPRVSPHQHSVLCVPSIENFSNEIEKKSKATKKERESKMGSAFVVVFVVLVSFVDKSFQQFDAYTATGRLDMYSPRTTVEPVFTSNLYRFGYRMQQSPLSINSQVESAYRLAAIYWLLRQMYTPSRRIHCKTYTSIVRLVRLYCS